MGTLGGKGLKGDVRGNLINKILPYLSYILLISLWMHAQKFDFEIRKIIEKFPMSAVRMSRYTIVNYVSYTAN